MSFTNAEELDIGNDMDLDEILLNPLEMNIKYAFEGYKSLYFIERSPFNKESIQYRQFKKEYESIIENETELIQNIHDYKSSAIPSPKKRAFVPFINISPKSPSPQSPPNASPNSSVSPSVPNTPYVLPQNAAFNPSFDSNAKYQQIGYNESYNKQPQQTQYVDYAAQRQLMQNNAIQQQQNQFGQQYGNNYNTMNPQYIQQGMAMNYNQGFNGGQFQQYTNKMNIDYSQYGNNYNTMYPQYIQSQQYQSGMTMAMY